MSNSMVIDLLQFAFQLFIVGFILRYAQLRLAGTDVGSALSFIY